MIFKTIASSVDKTRQSLALFNKDWNTYKTNWQNANGVFGKIGSVFSTAASPISSSDIQAIKAYNSQIDACVTSQTAFNRTMLNASPAAQNLVASHNGGKVSAQGMATAQNAAKASTIGLTIAQTALNTAIGMGIGLLISLVVKGIDKLVHANEEAIEKAEELRRKYEEFKSTNESNVTTLKDLKKEFEELSKGVSQYGDNVSLTTEQYERYKEIIQQIVGMSPSLAEGYSTENGYIADKNGLLERAIELQEQEYRNELRKITNLDNLKTSMSGYIAEYKEAFNGGLVTDDMSATATREFTDLQNAIYEIFNTNNRSDFSSEDMIRQIMSSIGIEDIEAEMAKYYNEYGYFQSQDFWKEYADIIAKNIEVITNSLSSDIVGLDDTVFDQNTEKVDSAAQSYLDMKDAISMANESIQRDLGYIAEYADGYSNLSTEQQKFVNEFLKGYVISDIMSESNNPFNQGWKFDEDKMASVKSQIIKFVEALSQDETTKSALADLYAIPTDEQSISEFIEQFRNALEVIKAYCQENGIEIPIAITDSEQTINDLEAQYQRAVDFAKDKFDGYDPTAFFKEHSINTQEEIDAWQKIAQGARDAAETEKEYIQGSTSNIENPISPLSISDTVDQLNTQLKPAFDSLQSAYQNIFTDDGKFALNSIDILSTCDTIKSKLDEMSDPEGLNLDVDYSAFEDFVRVLNNTESTEDDVEKAFDSLATSITQAALSGSEDFETMKAALEDLGVVNNKMVAFQALASNTEMLKQALGEANVSMDDFIVNTEDGSVEATNAGRAFLEEKVGAENCAEALNILAFQKQLCNLQEMNTANEVANLKTLAENAGYTGEVIQYLTELEKIYQEVASGTLTKEQILVKTGKAAVLKALIDNAASNINYEPKVDFSGATKAAGKAGKDAGKSYKDGLKEQLSDLDGVISGITSQIDDQISVINEQKSAALESIDAQKEALEEAKEAAIEALEAERDTQLAIVEEQKKTLEKQIKAKQDEIDAINDAADARQLEIDLQKAQYELERMQNQRTKLVYSEDKGMHYVQDTQGIRDAKESVDDAKRQIEIANLEKEKELLEDQAELLDERIDAITEYYDALIEQTEKAYDQQINDLEKQRKETESYFESIINGFESSKSKYQELTEILDKAELSAKLKQLGIDEEALLNGSEEEFNKLKDAYMNIVLQLNQGNDEVLTKLRELSGYEGTAPAMLEDSNTKLDTMNAELETASKEVGNINSFLGKTVLTTGETATNVGNVLSNLCELSSNLSTVNSLVAEEQTAFDNLKAKIDEVIKAINLKTQAIQEEQNAVSIATNSEIADFLLLKEKILEIKETLESFGTQDEGLISNIVRAIQSLNEISLENGIIGQFSNLKEAIDSVTSAISGNGASSGGERQGGDNGKGGETRGKDSKGGGSGSLADAITSMGETAAEVIGEADAEGDGTVIGEFGSLKTAVDNVTSAVGTGELEDGNNKGGDKTKAGGKSRSKDEDSGGLTGSIVNLGKTTEETLGEPGGDGIIGRFEQFKEPISEAAGHVQSISDGLDAIDGKEVECTITVNVNQTGGADMGGTVLGKMNLDSTSHSAKFGKSNANGTGKNKGLPKAERNALISEYGQTELTVFPNGNTVLTSEPTLMDLPKGTVIFNEDQTKQIMRSKVHVADTPHTDHATASIQPPSSGENRIVPFQPGDLMYDYMQKWNAYFRNTGSQTAILIPGSMYERSKQLYNTANQITGNNIAGKNQPNVHVGDIHITCPGVTSKEVAKQVGVELNHMFSGLHLDADQQSRLR